MAPLYLVKSKNEMKCFINKLKSIPVYRAKIDFWIQDGEFACERSLFFESIDYAVAWVNVFKMEMVNELDTDFEAADIETKLLEGDICYLKFTYGEDDYTELTIKKIYS